MNLTFHLLLVPRLRMSRAVPLLPVDVLLAWPGKTSPLAAVVALIA